MVIDRDIIRRLTSADDAFTEEKLRLLFWLTDRYIAQGRPFDLIFSLRNMSIIWQTLNTVSNRSFLFTVAETGPSFTFARSHVTFIATASLSALSLSVLF